MADIFQEFLEDAENLNKEMNKEFYTADELANEIKKIVYAIFYENNKMKKQGFTLMLRKDIIQVLELHAKKYSVGNREISANKFASKYLTQKVMRDLKENGCIEVK